MQQLGRLAVESFNAGDRLKAEGHCKEMTRYSQELIAILEELERDCAGS